MSERFLISQCSPTLAGVKTANLFRCSFHSRAELFAEVYVWNQKLYTKGIVMRVLSVSEKTALIYVYRPKLLSHDFTNEIARSLLKESGYPCNNTERCLNHLESRLRCDPSDFPHEIGLFLGYPPSDVCGFIEKGAKNCKYTGCWKVYDDVDSARKTFQMYRECTESFLEHNEQGMTIEQLAVAV